MIIVGRSRTRGYKVPNGARILWPEIAGNLPTGLTVDSPSGSMFVKGGELAQFTDTPVSSNTHSHTMPNTSVSPSHTHVVDGGNSSSSSGTKTFYPTPNQRYANSGHSHSIPADTSSSGAGHSHTIPDTGSSDAKPPYVTLYWVKATQDVAVPIKGIIMFDGPLANRPTGFELCDGTNGTPDMRNKFAYGASGDGVLLSTGGSSVHNHQNGGDSSSTGAHTHSGNMNSGTNSTSTKNASGYSEGTTASADGHNHNISYTLSSDGAHIHTPAQTNDSSSLPLYMKLYYLMRVS